MKLIILAAGQGKRLGCEQSLVPKVMRTAHGKPLLKYVLEAADFFPESDIWAVVGFMKETVTDAFPGINYAVQNERLGTGHAVMCAAEAKGDIDGDVMVINGDMPLFRRETLAEIAKKHAESGADCTLAAFEAKGEIPPFGHIVTDKDGFVKAIVEHKDATEEQKQIRLLNAGLYVFRARALFDALPKLGKSKASGEYYLTEVPAILQAAGGKTAVYVIEDETETLGVNTAEDLAAVEKALEERLK